MTIKIHGLRWAIVVGTMVLTLLFPHALSAGPPGNLLGVEAEAVPEEELGEIRGGYSGFYFAFDFSGSWDKTGGLGGTSNAQGTATYHSDLGNIDVVVNDTTYNGGDVTVEASSPTSTTLSTGDKAVKMSAFVGDINQTQGVIQICQVPGSNNVVTTVMNLQLTVINLSDPSKIAQLSSVLPGLVVH